MTRSRRRRGAAVLVVVMLALAACGDDDAGQDGSDTARSGEEAAGATTVAPTTSVPTTTSVAPTTDVPTESAEEFCSAIEEVRVSLDGLAGASEASGLASIQVESLKNADGEIDAELAVAFVDSFATGLRGIGSALKAVADDMDVAAAAAPDQITDEAGDMAAGFRDSDQVMDEALAGYEAVTDWVAYLATNDSSAELLAPLAGLRITAPSDPTARVVAAYALETCDVNLFARTDGSAGGGEPLTAEQTGDLVEQLGLEGADAECFLEAIDLDGLVDPGGVIPDESLQRIANAMFNCTVDLGPPDGQ